MGFRDYSDLYGVLHTTLAPKHPFNKSAVFQLRLENPISIITTKH